ELMPGVEVLANAMNTILRSRFYYETPDWLAALVAALIATAVLIALTFAQGRFESAKQIGALVGLLVLILVVSYIAFVHWLIVPPLVPALVSYAIAAPLALLRRSLNTSMDLDKRIAELTRAGDLLPLSLPQYGVAKIVNSNPAAFLARLTGANTVAIYARGRDASARYAPIALYGSTGITSLSKEELQEGINWTQFVTHHSITEEDNKGADNLPQRLLEANSHVDSSPRARPLMFMIGNLDAPIGALLLKQYPAHDLSAETLRLCVEIAAAYIRQVEDDDSGAQQSFSASPARWHFPRGVEWKARALGVLNRRLLARARFVDRAIRSVEDGLIVTDISGLIAFANPRASEILNLSALALAGSDLFQRLKEIEQSRTEDQKSDARPREMLMRLLVERTSVEREIVVGDTPPRHYILRISAVTSDDDGEGQILGLVAALSDVTEQHELQEMKTDVMTLVTHELRTPLTAIQGMSEVLAQFEVDAERQRIMHQAINDEAKRLSRMINEYMDIAKLESGARPLRLTSVLITTLLERVLLLLDPLAAQRDIRIGRRFASTLPALLADADLLAQAFTNLIANAIKYSPVKTEITVEAHVIDEALLIKVADQGYGIQADALPRIFEKFYRVPRVEDADQPGTGLGLALVREIVELHGGRLTVESEVGTGSTFSVRLPLSH
ncbi:MAG TPA: ATP-binding protein, partial [Pyrinomonadaceae bacterium]|nr:ATP-binding protein [Pyrinomonadaceae bacterium]